MSKKQCQDQIYDISGFLKISKNENSKKKWKHGNFKFLRRERWGVCEMMRHSTSRPCGNLVDGLPHDCHTEPRSIGWARHPRTSVNFVVAFVFLINLYVMVTSFVLLTLNISYWSFILCDFQLPSSIKPLLLTAAFVFQNVENDENFENFRKYQEIHFHFEILNWAHPHERKSTMKFQCWFCSTSFRRKPGWRFTAGSTFESNAFVHYGECCEYFSDKVYWKCSLEMSSFMELLDQSYVKCNRQFPGKFKKYENFGNFYIFENILIFWKK